MPLPFLEPLKIQRQFEAVAKQPPVFPTKFDNALKMGAAASKCGTAIVGQRGNFATHAARVSQIVAPAPILRHQQRPRKSGSMTPFPLVALRVAQILEPCCGAMKIAASLRPALVEEPLHRILGKPRLLL
jgi:hypothetical protein